MSWVWIEIPGAFLCLLHSRQRIVRFWLFLTSRQPIDSVTSISLASRESSRTSLQSIYEFSARSRTSTTRTCSYRTTIPSRSTSTPTTTTSPTTSPTTRSRWSATQRRRTRASPSSSTSCTGVVHVPLHAGRRTWRDPWSVRRRVGRAACRALRVSAGDRRGAGGARSRRGHRARPRRAGMARPRARGAALFARHMEVYVVMVDRIDQNIGRMMAELDEIGELDNTIFMFTSGQRRVNARREVSGTSVTYVHLLQGDDIEADLARIDEIGGPHHHAALPSGWAMAGRTPVPPLQDQHPPGWPLGAVHRVVAGRARAGARRDGELRRQYQHVTDLLPTLLEIVDGGTADEPQRRGRSRPLAGVELRARCSPTPRTEPPPRARRRA